ncbi:MAG: NADH-quinone oxidoreductase subunit J [Gammaproteobacteria bacterium]|nr:MAG: NADH-quinone oxidoreductase subunit J [Gammaproteobacteria bacterium]
MQTEKIFFYLFAAILIIAASMVVTVRDSVRAALFLVLAFFTSAGLWLMLHAEFLAILLVLVYVGAVMVLFLFVVMSVDLDQGRLREGFGRHMPLGLVITGIVIAEMVAILNIDALALTAPETPAYSGSNVEAIGRLMFGEYIYPVEIASVILLVGIIAAISMTLRGRRQSRYIPVSEQLAANKRDRLRVVDLRDAPVDPSVTDHPGGGQS